MKRITLIITTLALLSLTPTVFGQLPLDMQGEDIENVGDVGTTSITIGPDTWTNLPAIPENLDDLDDVDAGTPGTDEVLGWSGSAWTPRAAGAGDMIASTYDPAGGAKQVAFADDITAASITPVPVTNDWLYLSEGSYRSLDSSGVGVTNSLSIDPGLAAGIDFIRLDVRWDGVSTIFFPTTNLVTYVDTLDISSNVTSVVMFDSSMWETNWTAYQLPKEAE